MLRHARARHVHEHAHDPASGGRGARAEGAAGKAAAQGLLRRVLPRVREGDEPAANGAAGGADLGEARGRTDRPAHQEAARLDARRPDRRNRGQDGDEGARRAPAGTQAQLDTADEPPPLLHPSMADLYRSKVEELTAALQREDTRLEASEMLRGLVDSIVLTPRDGQLGIELRGNLAAMLTA